MESTIETILDRLVNDRYRISVLRLLEAAFEYLELDRRDRPAGTPSIRYFRELG